MMAILRRFLAECPQASGGMILYAGKAIRRLSDNALALPWPLLTGERLPLRVALCMHVRLPTRSFVHHSLRCRYRFQ
jgi:hypothetical protein